MRRAERHPERARPDTGRAPAVAALVVGLAALSPAIAKPPPFLPRELADVVERARQQQRAENPVREAPAPREIVDVATGELTLTEVLAQLSSEDYAQREVATQLLANVAMWDERALAEACATVDLCPEARVRVREALYSRFAASPGPAVGISMSPERSVNGVVILSVMQNYPASRVLRANDVLMRIGDVDLRADPTNQRVQEVIASYQPGDRVPMTILRDEREIVVEVELGQFANLDPNLSQRNEMILRQAWNLRSRRLGLSDDEAAAVAPAVSLFDWRRAAQRASLVRQGTGMVAGGEPAPVPGRLAGGVANIDNSRIGRVERVDPRIAPEPRGADVQRALDERMKLIETQIAELSQRMADARTPQREHEKLRETLEQLALQRRQIMLEMVRWADRND
ncbi:MAG: PDZ domain-containing protein [Phycisphaeraceae bacterium]|nr:PDZ domain-containing protein [Phycisphaeraceae bacterium]